MTVLVKLQLDRKTKNLMKLGKMKIIDYSVPDSKSFKWSIVSVDRKLESFCITEIKSENHGFTPEEKWMSGAGIEIPFICDTYVPKIHKRLVRKTIKCCEDDYSIWVIIFSLT